MRRSRLTVLLAVLLAAVAGCDEVWTGPPPESSLFDGPIDGLTGEQLRTFFAGDEAFGELFTPESGLGPVFNAPSCFSCHPGDGKGHPSLNLTRFGRYADGGFDYLEELGGPQLQNRAIPGYAPEALPAGCSTSVRSGPVASGLGLLEAVSAAAIVALEDPDDADGDGVSGRASFVVAPEFVDVSPDCACEGCRLTPDSCTLLGRFGRKATSVNLLQQTVGAYHADMGITSDLIPTDVYNPLFGGPAGDGVANPEVPSSTVQSVVFYLQTLRPPPRRSEHDPEVKAGEAHFHSIGCASCHVPELPTGASPIAPLNHVTAHAYTDLLLHDMGPALADDYPEGAATGTEWRTTPLWGLGIIDGQLGGAQFYLHDGRARTLEAAISFHDGEGLGAALAFAALGEAEKRQLITFLRSL